MLSSKFNTINQNCVDHKKLLRFIQKTKLAKVNVETKFSYLSYFNDFLLDKRTNSPAPNKSDKHKREIIAVKALLDQLDVSDNFKIQRNKGVRRTANALMHGGYTNAYELQKSKISPERKKEILATTLRLYEEHHNIPYIHLKNIPLTFNREADAQAHAEFSFEDNLVGELLYGKNYKININTHELTNFKNSHFGRDISDLIHEAQHIIQMELSNAVIDGRINKKSLLFQDALLFFLQNQYDLHSENMIDEVYDRIFTELDANEAGDLFEHQLYKVKTGLRNITPNKSFFIYTPQ